MNFTYKNGDLNSESFLYSKSVSLMPLCVLLTSFFNTDVGFRQVFAPRKESEAYSQELPTMLVSY